MRFHFSETINFFLIVIQSSSIYLVCTCVLSRFSHIQLFATLWIQPARLLCLWDSPGKNTGVGCIFSRHRLIFSFFIFILEINLLSFISFANIFFHFEGCCFISFMVFFAVQKLLSLTRSRLFIFVLIFITVEGRSKKVLP